MYLKCFILILLMVPVNYSFQIRFHKGFVMLNQENIMMSPNFTAHHKYTFEIFSQNTEKEDFLPNSCFLNDHKFLDEFGCLIPNDFIMSKYETNNYNKSKSQKQLMVRFIAPSDDLVFTCAIYVLKCGGCAQNSCKKKTDLRAYQSTLSTILCETKNNTLNCKWTETAIEISVGFADQNFSTLLVSTEDSKQIPFSLSWLCSKYVDSIERMSWLSITVCIIQIIILLVCWVYFLGELLYKIVQWACSNVVRRL